MKNIRKITASLLTLLIVFENIPDTAYALPEDGASTVTFSITDAQGNGIAMDGPSLTVSTDEGVAEGDVSASENELVFTPETALDTDVSYSYELQVSGYQNAEGTFNGSDTDVAIQLQEDTSGTLATSPVSMTYGDRAAALSGYVTVPDGYTGGFTYSISSGSSVISLSGGKITAKKSGSAVVHVTSAEDSGQQLAGDIAVTVARKDLGTLTKDDVTFAQTEVTYSGNSTWQVSGTVNETLLKQGDALMVTADVSADSPAAGTHEAAVTGAVIADSDKYTASVDISGMTATIQVDPLVIGLKADSIRLDYGSQDWYTVKNGAYDSFFTKEKIRSILSMKTDVPEGLAEEASAAMGESVYAVVNEQAIKDTGYNVGTYSGLVTLAVAPEKTGNFAFTIDASPVLRIVAETTPDDTALWDQVEVDKKSAEGTCTDGNTVYLAENGYVTFRVKDSAADRYDSVAIRIDKDYSKKIKGSSTSGPVVGTFYLYDSEDPSNRTDASQEDGLQDNTIPEGAVYIDADAPSIWINNKKEEETGGEITFNAYTSENIPTMAGKYEDTGSGIKKVTYTVFSETYEDSGLTRTVIKEEEVTDREDWMEEMAFDLSGIREDGYYILSVQAEDRTGNTSTYGCGLVLDSTAPDVSVEGLTDGGIYNNDVPYTLDLTDMAETVSGLSEIRAEVAIGGSAVEGGRAEDGVYRNSFTLEQADIDALVGSSSLYPEDREALEKHIRIQGCIGKELNASGITVRISAKDRAGNTFSRQYVIDIDTDAPQVEISYDNNEARNGKYFKAERTAAVKITERSFDESLVKVILGIDGTEKTYSIDDLSKGKAEGVSLTGRSMDGNAITYRLCFGRENAEHGYGIDVSLTDRAGNASDPVTFAPDTAAGNSFVIDMVPVRAQMLFKKTDGTRLSLSDAVTYSNQTVNASISIQEKYYDAAEASATILQTDGAGNTVAAYDTDAFLKALQSSTIEGKEKGTYSLPSFSSDACYQISMHLADKAGNVTEISGLKLTVDKTAPTGSIRIQAGGTSGTYSKANDTARFWHITNGTAAVDAEAADATSGVESVQYCLYTPAEDSSGTFAVPSASSLGEWKTWTGQLTISQEGQEIVYLKITDKAGNICYLNADEGVIIDVTAPDKPQITLSTGSDSTIFNSDVPFTFSVTDPASSGTYAGLKSVTYEVLKDGVVTQSNTYDFADRTARTRAAAYGETVSAAKNNSNHVTIRVTAVDYAGNTSSAEKNIKIDTTAPRIEIVYDRTTDNGYYNSARTATIRVYERNFDPSGFTFTQSSELGTNVSVGSWSLASNMGESDDAVSTAAVVFLQDDTYTVTASAKDLAGNSASLGRTDRFTVDRTAPAVRISFDKNNAANGHYYNTDRTAVITVTERNFSKDAFTLDMNASLDGKSIQAPALSAWSSSGNTHRATLVFKNDGDYAFSCSAVDMAGNSSGKTEVSLFTIDKTAPAVSFTGVADQKAYNGAMNMKVEYSDRNAASEEQMSVVLEGERHEEKLLTGTYQPKTGGGSIAFADFAKTRSEDDVYTMTASYADLAGNKTVKSITFSVNRFGSNFTFDDATEELLEKYYLKEGEDLVIYETNVSSLTHKEITCGFDGVTKTLKEGTDYTVQESSDEGWKVCTYKVKSTNFQNEGLYELVVTSTDEAGNTQDNKLKEEPIGFVVDRTAPSAILTGAEDGDRFQTKTKDITVKLTDNYALDRAEILLDGEPVEEIDRDKLESFDGLYVLTIKESNAYQTISAKVYDAAGNEAESESLSILVTPNAITQFFYNRPLFFGTIAGAAALLVLLYVMINLRNKRNRSR